MYEQNAVLQDKGIRDLKENNKPKILMILDLLFFQLTNRHTLLGCSYYIIEMVIFIINRM